MVAYKNKKLKCIICGIEFIGIRSFTKYCKKCRKKITAEQQYKYKKRWRENNREKVRKKANKDYHSGKGRNRFLKYQYGISIKDYNILFNAQNGCCKICGRHQSKLKRRLFVDHDHKTGKIRGLLCEKCNFALGLTNNSIEILQSIIRYLKEK